MVCRFGRKLEAVAGHLPPWLRGETEGVLEPLDAGDVVLSYESGRQVRIPLVAVSRARLEVEF